MKALLTLFVAAAACAIQEPPQDVVDLDLDDLMKVKVVSVAKKEQSLNDVPAAVYVLRGEDIKRSGATSIPGALRAVPGLEVARAGASSWAVSSRGFNSTSANKMLVLIDGRSVYSPLHSGVFWDVQDVLMEHIDRIEVIRGPGGSLWGSNAVNGIINIIRKPAGETQGGYVTTSGGTENRFGAGARLGFKASDDVDLRWYGKYGARDDQALGTDPGKQAFDGWWQGRTGFRADWKAGPRDHLSVSSDWYLGQSKVVSSTPDLNPPFSLTTHDRNDVGGGNLLARWDRQIDETTSWSLQAYYDYSSRSSDLFDDTLHTGDFDFQCRLKPAEGHDFNWGLGYRVYRSELDGGFFISPSEHTDDLVSAFIQDEILLVKGRLSLTIGSKVENNDYTGYEVQPSARLLWTPADRHAVWTAVSRAVRTPSIVDADFRANVAVFPGPTPTVLAIFGNEDFKAEELIAFEAGYRVHPVDPLYVDVAVFYNRYKDLETIGAGAPFSESDPQPTHDVQPYILQNGMKAQTAGVEVATSAQVAPWWLVQVNYTYLRMNLDPDDDASIFDSEAPEKQNPHHQVWARSSMDLPYNLTLDVMGRYVSRLDAFDVDAYVESDVRLAWRDPVRHIEAAVIGQSLVQNSHPEFNSAAQRSEVERGIYASITWQF